MSSTLNFGLQGANQGKMDSGFSKDTSSVGASLDVSWELDVWGRIRAGRNAAREDLIATKSDYDYARLSLAAQTAKVYFFG